MQLSWTELNWSGVELSRAEAQVACSREITDNLLNMAQHWSMCSFGQAKRESAGAGTPSLSCYSARTTLSSLAQSLDFHWVGHTDRKRKRSGALGEFRSRDILPDTFASQSASLSECVCGVCGCVGVFGCLWVFPGVCVGVCLLRHSSRLFQFYFSLHNHFVLNARVCASVWAIKEFPQLVSGYFLLSPSSPPLLESVCVCLCQGSRKLLIV